MERLLLVLLLIFSFNTQAQTTYTYTGTGDWDTTANWSPSYPGTTINAADTVIISSNATAINNATITNLGTIDISGILENQTTGIINNSGTVTIPALGTLANFGTFSNTNATFTNAGTVVNNTNANFEVTDNTSIHLFRNQATFTNHGTLTLTLASSPSNTNTGTINNTGVFDIPNNFSFPFPNQGTIANHGVFTINSDLINDGVFLNTNEFNGSYQGPGSFTNEGITIGRFIIIEDFGLLTNTGTITTTSISMRIDSQVFTNEGVVKIYGGETGFRFNRKIVNNNIFEILPDGIAGLSNDTFINNGILLNRGILSTIVFGFSVIATLHNSETGLIDNRATLVIDVFDDGMPSTLINDGTIINTGIYTNNGALVNNGTITNSNALNNGGSIAIEAMGTLSTSGTTSNQSTGSITNAGTITTLELGTFTNAGTITMDTTGTLSTSGSTNNQATASITNAGTITTLELGAFTNAGTITMDTTGTLSTSGTASNQATGSITNSGTVTTLALGTLNNFGTFSNTNATFTNAGTVVNNTNANFEVADNTSMHLFRNQATFTNHGTLTLTLASSPSNTNTGTINNTGVFDITITRNRGTFTNQGTINNHGALSVFSITNRSLGNLNNEGVFLNTNELNLSSYRGTGQFTNEGITNGGGIIIEDFGLLTNTGTITTTSISMRRDSQVFTNEGVVKIFGGETGFRFNRKIVNNNIFEILPDGIAGLSNDTFINNGTILNRGTLSTIAFGVPIIATLHNSETGVIDNRATLVIDVFDDGMPSTLINDGTIINTGIYTNSGALVNNGGFTNNNIFENSGTFSNPGILSGSNTSHNQDFTNTGTLSPGNTTASIGTYVLNNNYTHNNVAILDIEIESATEFDVIAVSGVANLSGTLDVSLPTGYAPQQGDVFTILTANSISGTFDTLNLPSPNGQIWEVDYNPTNVTIRVPFICDVDVAFTAPEGVCVDSGIQSGLGGGSPVVIVESTTVTINISYDVFGFASFVGGNIVFDSSGAMLSTDVTADNGASGSSVNLLNATALGDTITLTFDNGQTPNIVANTVIIGASGAVNFISGTNFTVVGDILEFVSGIGTATTDAVGSRIYSGPGVTDDGNGVTYSFDPLTAGIGTHTLTYSYTDINNCTDSARDTIEVFAIDNSVSLVNEVLTANEVGATYQWFECPNILLTDEINQSFTPSTSGDYKVTITKGGCVVESNCITVTLPTLDVTTFENSAEFSMFPNPSSEYIKIKSPLGSDFKIISMLGYTVKEFKVGTNAETTIFIGDLASGVYFVTPRNSSKIASQKLIVKK